jgi:membrane protein required for colicin V production
VASLDWIILALLLASMLLGALRGLVYEVLSVLGWAASFYAAQWIAPSVALMLPIQSLSQSARYAAAFVLVFIAAIFIAGLLAVVLKKMVEAIGLRPVDRTMGAAFGLVRGLILLLVATVVMNMTSLNSSDWWRESKGAAVLASTLTTIKPMLPERFAAFLN